MSYEPKPGDGALFKNENRASDKHPNATGYVIAPRDIKAGEKMNLAAWTKEGKKGKFQSIRMSDMRGQDDRPQDDREQDPYDSGPPF